MKRILLAALLTGCTTTQPVKPAIEVTVIQIPPPRIKGEMVEVIEVDEQPIHVRHTWMTGKEVEAAKKERLIKDHPECDCQPGDPLCSCVE